MKLTKTQLCKKTKRLEIRPLELKDFKIWRAAKSEMRKPQNEWDETNWDPKFLTLRRFREILEDDKKHRAADKAYIFGIFRKDDGSLIGSVGLFDVSRANFQNAYIGYRIYNTFWGYGYGKEAVTAALQWAFHELKIHRVEAGIQPHNVASIALAESVGMKKESLSKKRIFVKNKWVDLLLFVSTTEDFRIKYKFPGK